MKILVSILVALIVFAALVTPQLIPHQTTTANTHSAAMYVADGPTPTPTRDGSAGGCQGGGGC